MSQDSTLYGGSVSTAAIYQITQGDGFEWGDYIHTEVNIDGKPRQLTKAKHNGDPLVANVKNPRDSDFTANAKGYSIDGRQLSVTDFMALETLDVAEWKTTFPRFQPSGKSVDLNANPEIKKVVFDLLMEAVQTQMNQAHSGGSALYSGFEDLILADSDCTEVLTGADLTTDNIIDRVFALRNAVPPRLRKRKDLTIFCSYAAADLFDEAARETNTAAVTVLANGVRSITKTKGGSVQLVPMEGLSDDFMFITVASKKKDSNLKQGFWVEADKDAIKFYRTEEADQIWKLILRVSLGVQYVTGEDIFFLTGEE